MIKAYRELHKRRDCFTGRSILPHVEAIARLVAETKSETLLDYGCGKGDQYFDLSVHDAWGGIIPTLYDPGLPKWSVLPNRRFHGIICTDVMEHVPKKVVKKVLSRMFNRSERFVFLSICTRPAKKTFPDGSNVHVTIKPPKWWRRVIDQAAKGRRYEVVFT